MTASRRKPPAKTPPSPTTEGAASPAPRTETYEAVRPDGSVVIVTRDLDTGEATYLDK